jgi:hypothetical protein
MSARRPFEDVVEELICGLVLVPGPVHSYRDSRAGRPATLHPFNGLFDFSSVLRTTSSLEKCQSPRMAVSPAVPSIQELSLSDTQITGKLSGEAQNGP